MAIHFYLDELLTQQISEGDHSQPDFDTYNGTDGEIKDRQLWIANEQTRLAADVDTLASQIELQLPRFVDGEFIIVDSEQMQITAGGGTTTITVKRAQSGTNPASHSANSTVYSGYDYTGLIVDPVDETETDESVWYKVALTQALLDEAIEGTALLLGTKRFDQTLSFWRRCTVLPGIPVQNKVDIKLKLSGTENPIV